MDTTDKARFAMIMGGLAENFGATLSTAGINVRFMALQQFSIEDVEKACMGCLMSRKYTSMATVAEILDFLGGGSVDDRAQVEASKVWIAVKEYGGYRSVCFDDAVTQAVIVNGFGGWPQMCGELMVDQQKWFVKEFCQMYGAYSRQGIKHTGLLGGRGENAKGIALIGDTDKAKAILDTPQIEHRESVDHVQAGVKQLTDNVLND